MENVNRNHDEMELSISIKDLFMRICLKWRVMIAVAIIFAILFNGIAVVKSYQEAQSLNQEAAKTAEEKTEEALEQALEDLESAKEVLSKREISEAELARDAYNNLSVQYNNVLLYSQNSLKMQLNPGNVPTAILYYSVDNHYKAEYPIMEGRDNTDDIVNAVCEGVVREDVIDSVTASLEGDIDAVYVRELIEVESEPETGGFVIKLWATDIRNCEVMADAMKSAIKKLEKEFRGVYGAVDLILVTETYDEMFDKDLMSYQVDKVNTLNNMRNQFFNTVNGLNAEQKTYYYSLLDYDALQVEKTSQQQEISEDIKTEEEATVEYINIKYILVGFILGILLVCCWGGVQYLFTSRLRVADDLETAFGIKVFGIVKSNKRKSKSLLDRLVYRIFCGKDNFSEEDYIRMICAGVRIASQKRQINNLFITSTCNEAEIQKLIGELVERLKKDISTVQTGVSVIIDPESLEKLAGAEAVVLVEKLGASRYTDVKNEIEKCSMNCVPVLGGIVVD